MLPHNSDVRESTMPNGSKIRGQEPIIEAKHRSTGEPSRRTLNAQPLIKAATTLRPNQPSNRTTLLLNQRGNQTSHRRFAGDAVPKENLFVEVLTEDDQGKVDSVECFSYDRRINSEEDPRQGWNNLSKAEEARNPNARRIGQTGGSRPNHRTIANAPALRSNQLGVTVVDQDNQDCFSSNKVIPYVRGVDDGENRGKARNSVGKGKEARNPNATLLAPNNLANQPSQRRLAGAAPIKERLVVTVTEEDDQGFGPKIKLHSYSETFGDGENRKRVVDLPNEAKETRIPNAQPQSQYRAPALWYGEEGEEYDYLKKSKGSNQLIQIESGRGISKQQYVPASQPYCVAISEVPGRGSPYKELQGPQKPGYRPRPVTAVDPRSTGPGCRSNARGQSAQRVLELRSTTSSEEPPSSSYEGQVKLAENGYGSGVLPNGNFRLLRKVEIDPETGNPKLNYQEYCN